MKNLLIILTLLLVIMLSACGQKNPPETVKKEFSARFADAKSVSWDMEKANEWEAEFKSGGKEMTASFDNSGKWLETEAEVSLKDLPAAVTNTLSTEFKGYKTGECSTIENPELKGYEISLKNKEGKLTVIIGADGNILKKESSTKEKEETAGEKKEKEDKEK